jgi:hypothetical protein
MRPAPPLHALIREMEEKERLVAGSLDSVLDQTESAARIARLQPPPRLQWRSYSFEYESTNVTRSGDPFDLETPDEVVTSPMPVPAGSAFRIQRFVHAPFRPKWLVVATAGFRIRRLASSVYMLLEDVDGDLYLTTEWDRLALVDKLDRFQLPDYTCGQQESLHIEVTPRAGANVTRFSAMVIGQELVEGRF